jgi:hypothetical protein
LLKGGAVPARGPEHLDRGQIPAFYPEEYAGPGKGLFPGDLEVDAFDTVRGAAVLLIIHYRQFTITWSILSL